MSKPCVNDKDEKMKPVSENKVKTNGIRKNGKDERKEKKKERDKERSKMGFIR